MEETGMSLFKGAGSIHINNSVQERLEEQEELEDQKRLHAELQNKLDNGFDDLYDDEEQSSVNSSANFTVDATTHHGCNPIHASNLPSYGESVNHQNQYDLAQAYTETPKTHFMMRNVDGNQQYYCSPLGAGDGQNDCHEDYKGHTNGVNTFSSGQGTQMLMNYEKLKLMYKMQVEECKKLVEDKKEMQIQLDMGIDSLRTRLIAALADKDQTEISLRESHHLLSSYKLQLADRDQTICNLNKKIMTGEEDKEQLKLELQSTHMSLQESEKRLHTLQVAQSHNSDALFREQLDRHREEVDGLQEDLHKAKNRLEEKDNEIKRLDRRCKEIEREREDTLVAKTATINKLAKELESAQNQITSGENCKLKERLSQLTCDRNTARGQVKEMGSKLESITQELVMCRDKLSKCQKEYDDWKMNLQQILRDTLSEAAYIVEPPSPGKLSTLKDILMRYRHQAQKLSTIQEELSKRDKKLELCRKQESELRSKLEEQKGIEVQLKSRIAVLQNKLELLGDNSDCELLDTYKQQNGELQTQIDDLRAEYKQLDMKYIELEMEYDKLKVEKGSRASMTQEANADLLREIETCSTKLKNTLKDNRQLMELYVKVCSERDAKCREIKETEYKLKQFEKEKESIVTKEAECQERLDKERQQVEKLKADLVTEKEELVKANKRISELQKEYSEKQKQFTNKLNKYIEEERNAVQKELEICTQCDKYIKNIKNLEEQVNQCHLKLATQGSNEELMKELKKKANFFNDYILDKYQRLQNQSDVATNTDEDLLEKPGQTTVHNHTEQTHEAAEDILAASTNIMMKEREIRDQIAEKFTLEIKTIEMNCSKKLKEMENSHICNMNKLKVILERKADEVETLKQFILSERAKITEIIEAKENEISILIKESNSMQEQYQELRDKATELKNCLEKAQAKIAKLKIEYEKKNLELSNEREKSARGRSDLMQRMQILDSRTSQIEAQHELLKEKYKNVKKTALTYKEYASKKDEHVESELERIKSHYKDIVTDLQSKIQQLVNKRQQSEVTERINKIKTNFDAMMADNATRPL